MTDAEFEVIRDAFVALIQDMYAHDDSEEVIRKIRNIQRKVIRILETVYTTTKIPENYVYDTERSDILVYRHKYTGEEIHVIKDPTTYYIEPDSIGRDS